MKAQIISPKELGASERGRWLELCRENPDLGSPYFHPEFAVCAASIRPDARVAVLEQSDKTVGFFPFQRNRLGIGTPIGGGLSDFQGVVCAPDFSFDPRELVARAGLFVWEFDHLLESQKLFEPFGESRAESPLLDVAEGFDAYLRARKAAGSDRLTQVQRKLRKLEREVGSVEFVPETTDRAVFDFVIHWKSQQCRRTGVLDFFNKLPWTKPLVERILHTKRDGFAGSLSALYVGGKLVAAHLGMRTESVLHWWFPVYDTNEELAKYSPGMILLLKVAEYASTSGAQVLDLGKGGESYKSSFASRAVMVTKGAVDTRTLPATLWRTGKNSEQWLRKSPALEPLREKARQLREQLRKRALYG